MEANIVCLEDDSTESRGAENASLAHEPTFRRNVVGLQLSVRA